VVNASGNLRRNQRRIRGVKDLHDRAAKLTPAMPVDIHTVT
jgi:hypothetical protein